MFFLYWGRFRGIISLWRVPWNPVPLMRLAAVGDALTAFAMGIGAGGAGGATAAAAGTSGILTLGDIHIKSLHALSEI
jgi:hypothetical protein